MIALRFALLAFLLLIAPTSARAADAPPQWQIVPAQSSLTFSGTQQGAGFDGKFADFSGTIAFDPDHPESGHGSVKIAMNSATTNSADRDQYIAQDAWFSVAKFPTATFEIVSFEKQSADQYVAHGKLTLRDATLPLNLPFTLKIEGATAHIEGTTTLNRLDFGVGQGEWKDTSMVGNAVTVKVSVTATKQK